ncbi:MAG TPA: SDR family oxidoreductase [Vicinamibacteria bacterium]|nr:SDR family oxidoreductase [Vicinamibacteria bacterium]
MTRSRILVTGASGLVGGRLAEVLSAAHDVTAVRHRGPVPEGLPVVDADILDPGAMDRAFETARPQAVVHCAAMADPDRCEREPDLAHRCNVESSAEIARRCRETGARFVTFSTDLVFAGDRAFVTEEEPPRPLQHYGRTKAEAEDGVLAESRDAVVLRIALVIGRGFGPRSSASEAVAAALAAGRRPRLFLDQYRTPIDPASIADAVARVLERSASGRFHVGGAERLSRYELGQRVARVLGLPADLEGMSSAEQAVPRPGEASLDSSRARRELGWEPRPLDDMIRDGRRPTV